MSTDPTSRGPQDESPPNRELAVIEREAQIRALSHPERARILQLLVDRPGTAKQVADWVEGTRGRVHYHIKELEKAGLVEIVSTEERGGVVQKYYRAVARNFAVTHGLGEHEGLSGDVKEAISTSMLDWRRKSVLDVDQDAIAGRIVRDCIATKSGDLVLIKGDFVHADVIAALHRAIDACSAHGLVFYRGDTPASFLTRWKAEIRSIIVLEEPVDRLTEGRPVPPPDDSPDERARYFDRLAAKATEFSHASVPGDPLEDPMCRELIESGVRAIHFAYPTPQRAEMLGLDFRTLHDACWTALDVDYHDLAARCDRVRALLSDRRLVHVRARGGTDLRFEITGREVFVDDGIISDWEVENARGFNHLPAGKLVVAPLEGTAEGTLFSPITDYLGVPIRGIRLTFRDGNVVTATADENEDLLLRVLEAGRGDHRSLGGFEIGTNDKITRPIGYSVWDGKSLGSVTLGIGDNRLIGGKNESNFAWSFFVAEPRVSVDGTTILEDRRFLE